MKVLHVYRTCYPETNGGLEQVIRFICKGCIKHGVESTILTLGNENKEYDFEGTKVVVLKKNFEISSNGFSFSLFKKFRQLSKKNDIIHFHYPWPTGDLFIYLNKQKPMLVTYHSDIIKQRRLKALYAPLESRFLKRANTIIATSKQYVASSQNLKKHKNKISIIPLAIDPTDYEKIENQNKNKWIEKIKFEKFFLFIGVLRYYKGLEYLLDAAGQTKLPVIIAGDGPMKEQLEKKIIEKELTNVILLGHVSEQDKLSLLSLCHAFIFPSHLRSEAFGMSLIEAQHFKKPIISCEIGTGSSFVNINEETGIVVSPENSNELAKAMQRLHNDAELCKRMGEQGAYRTKEFFYIDTMAGKYYNEYKKLLSSY